MFSPHDLTTEGGNQKVFIKEEEEVNYPEFVLVKEEPEIEKSDFDGTIKQELLLWDEPEPVEDVKALGVADASSSGSCAAFTGELSACPPVLRGDEGALVIGRGNEIHELPSSEPNRSDQFLICGLCEYRTNRTELLDRHLRIHKKVKSKPFACNHCQYQTDRKDNLKTHLRIHKRVVDKPFACNHCSYQTDTKGSLTRHLFIHKRVRDKPFACNLCQYQTDLKGNLTIHLRIHESVRDKPFACNHCQYQTDRKGNLNKHLRTHGSVRV